MTPTADIFKHYSDFSSTFFNQKKIITRAFKFMNRTSVEWDNTKPLLSFQVSDVLLMPYSIDPREMERIGPPVVLIGSSLPNHGHTDTHAISPHMWGCLGSAEASINHLILLKKTEVWQQLLLYSPTPTPREQLNVTSVMTSMFLATIKLTNKGDITIYDHFNCPLGREVSCEIAACGSSGTRCSLVSCKCQLQSTVLLSWWIVSSIWWTFLLANLLFMQSSPGLLFLSFSSHLTCHFFSILICVHAPPWHGCWIFIPAGGFILPSHHV